MTDVQRSATGESTAAATSELGALEARLFDHRSVLDCAVLRRIDQVGESVVVVYLVSQGAIGLDEVRAEALAANVVLPDALVRVSNIPLLSDGRVDERALTELPVIDRSAVAHYREDLSSTFGGSIGETDVVVEWNTPNERPLRIDELLPRETAAAPRAPRASTRIVDDPHAPPSWSVGAPIISGPDAPKQLSELLMRAAAEHSDHRVTCVELDGEYALAYPELRVRAERILAGLRAAGLRAGDVVIFEIARNLDFIAAFWGCTFGGFVATPIAVPHSADATSAAALKLKNAWDLLGEPFVLTSDELEPLLLSLAASLEIPALRTLTVERLSVFAPDDAHHDATPDDLALLLLTSGSSGKPKAVTQSHAALLAHVAGNAQQHGFTSADVPLNWLALDHVGSIVMLHIGGVALGANQVHARTDYILQDPLRWLDLIERFRATITWAPNFAFALVNDRGDDVAARRWDLSSMKFIVNGGEAVVASTARRFLTRLIPHGLPRTAMRPAWGMSETSSAEVISSSFRLETSTDFDDFVEVGGPNPGFEIRIVDDEQRVVPEGREGHMEVRGRCVTRGYLNNPDANAAAFTGDGWFRTGDLGWLRAGRMTITGREKGEIIVNGVNYPAHEVEAAVEEVSGVSASFAAAFAVREPGDETDSLAIAFHTTRRDDAELSELIRRIRQTVFDRVAVLPRFVLPVEQSEIPKTGIGKIQRAALTKAFAAGALATAVKRSEQLTRRAETIPDWFFRWTWRKRVVAPVHAIGVGCAVIALADELGVAARLMALAREAGARAQIVERHTLREFIARVAPEERLVVLVGRQFGKRGTREGDGADSSSDEAADAFAMSHAMVDIVRSLAAARSAAGPTELVVYDSRAQHVLPSDDTTIGKASVIGLLRTIPAEHPTITVRHVDLPDGDAGAAARMLFAELSDARDEAEVAYRNGERWVRRLVKAPPYAANRESALVSADGFVLVVGGLGGIGAEVTRHVLRSGGTPVLITGRASLAAGDARHRDAFAALAALGVVRYAEVDIADFEGLERAVADASREWGRPLAAVVHAAGVFEPRLLVDESEATLAPALRAKVRGGWNVHRILMANPRATFVAFSSVNGELGGYAAGAYSAANAFLDSLVQHHARQLGRAAYSLAWTLWDSVGMSREHAFKDSAARRGYRAVSAQQGIISLSAAVRSEPGQLLIGLDATSPHIRRFLDEAPLSERIGVTIEHGAISTAVPAPAPDRFGVAVPFDVRERNDAAGLVAEYAAAFASEMEVIIAGVWCDVLSTGSVGPNENFFDAGGTSLLVATATRRLRDALGGERDVAMTDIYRFPSVRLLAAHYIGDGSGDAATLEESEERGKARRAQRLDRRRRGS